MLNKNRAHTWLNSANQQKQIKNNNRFIQLCNVISHLIESVDLIWRDRIVLTKGEIVGGEIVGGEIFRLCDFLHGFCRSSSLQRSSSRSVYAWIWPPQKNTNYKMSLLRLAFPIQGLFERKLIGFFFTIIKRPKMKVSPKIPINWEGWRLHKVQFW